MNQHDLHVVVNDLTEEEKSLYAKISNSELPPLPFRDWKKFAANLAIRLYRTPAYSKLYEPELASKITKTAQEIQQEALEFLRSAGIINDDVVVSPLSGEYQDVVRAMSFTRPFRETNNQRFFAEFYDILGVVYEVTDFGGELKITRKAKKREDFDCAAHNSDLD